MLSRTFHPAAAAGASPLARAALHTDPRTHFKWCVVGAGPAGIAIVGKLIDNGVAASDIAWVDPKFDVGLLGRKWRSVSSNTSVATFERFLSGSQAFEYARLRDRFDLSKFSREETCKLHFVAEPLVAITAVLKEKVACFHGKVDVVERAHHSGLWTLNYRADSADASVATLSPDIALGAENVVLAVGSRPSTLPSDSVPVLPVEEALCIDTLRTKVAPSDTVAVFGSSHSAIMIVRDLLVCGVPRVINFYRSPLKYAVFYPDGTVLNDNTGLKGKTAEWAKANLESKVLPDSIRRYEATPENIALHLPGCTKVVYAIGFEREDLPEVRGLPRPLPYDNRTGRIAARLYGVGIAFPELGPDAAGNMELRVGMWKFMDYFTRIVPLWIANATENDHEPTNAAVGKTET